MIQRVYEPCSRCGGAGVIPCGYGQPVLTVPSTPVVTTCHQCHGTGCGSVKELREVPEASLLPDAETAGHLLYPSTSKPASSQAAKEQRGADEIARDARAEAEDGKRAAWVANQASIAAAPVPASDPKCPECGHEAYEHDEAHGCARSYGPQVGTCSCTRTRSSLLAPPVSRCPHGVSVHVPCSECDPSWSKEASPPVSVEAARGEGEAGAAHQALNDMGVPNVDGPPTPGRILTLTERLKYVVTLEHASVAVQNAERMKPSLPPRDPAGGRCDECPAPGYHHGKACWALTKPEDAPASALQAGTVPYRYKRYSPTSRLWIILRTAPVNGEIGSTFDEAQASRIVDELNRLARHGAERAVEVERLCRAAVKIAENYGENQLDENGFVPVRLMPGHWREIREAVSEYRIAAEERALASQGLRAEREEGR